MIKKEPKLVSQEQGVEDSYTLEVVLNTPESLKAIEEYVDFSYSHMRVYTSPFTDAEGNLLVEEYDYYFYGDTIDSIRMYTTKSPKGVIYPVVVLTSTGSHTFNFVKIVDAQQWAYLLNKWRINCL